MRRFYFRYQTMAAVSATDKIRILERTHSDSGAVSTSTQSEQGSADQQAVKQTTSECSVSAGGDVYEVIGVLPEVGYNTFPDDAAFTALMREAELALDAGLKPRLSQKGTSGCYFILDREQVGMLCLQLLPGT